MSLNPPLSRKLRMGLVGGAGGFIGHARATAALSFFGKSRPSPRHY
jgi:hypothetical protein